MRRVALLLIALGSASVALAQQGTTATVEVTQPATKVLTKAPMYDEDADAKQQIAAALKHAKKENQRVLIQWGFNTCHWCQLLHDRYASDQKLAHELLYEYTVVYVDTGKNGKNMDLAASYGADVKKEGFPYLTILDAGGKALANQETSSLELKGPDGKSIIGEGAGHDSAKVLSFLKSHEAAPQVAESVLTDAKSQAKAEGKKVFLHFGAPWCGWCKKLEAWLDRDDVSKTFGKDYVEVKIDQDRMTGAKDIFARYNKNFAKSGIPWFVILDPATGDPLATSDGEKGNIGFPSEDGEIAHFVTMLNKTRKNLSDSDIATLKITLEAGRKN